MEPLQMLERNYDSFISREQPFAFFKGLADYLDYVFTANLKAVFDEQMEERDALYSRMQSFEDQALTEVLSAKDILLKAIKRSKIDTSEFKYIGFGLPPFKSPLE